MSTSLYVATAMIVLTASACADAMPPSSACVADPATCAAQVAPVDAGDADAGSVRLTTRCDSNGFTARVLRAGDHVLARGFAGWALLDVQTGRELARGSTENAGLAGPVALADDVMLVPTPRPASSSDYSFQLLDLRDRRLLAKLPTNADMMLSGYVGLSADGRRAWHSNPSGITVWKSTGEVLLSLRTRSDSADLRAIAGRLLVSANDQASVIDLESGEVSVPVRRAGSSFRWFEDGRHLVELTRDGTRPRFYTPDGKLVQEVARDDVKVLGGSAEYYWAHHPPSTRWGLYRVGSPLSAAGLPAPIYALPETDEVKSGQTVLGVFSPTRDVTPGGAQIFRVVTLHSERPTISQVFLPGGSIQQAATFSSDALGRWVSVAGNVIYASEAAGSELAHPIGCRAP